MTFWSSSMTYIWMSDEYVCDGEGPKGVITD